MVAFLGCDDSPSAPHDEVDPCRRAEPRCEASIPIEAGRDLPVFTSRPLDEPDPAVRRVLVIIHGTNRNADSYFETGVAAAGAAGVFDETLVVAPHFRTVDDDPEPGAPYWTSAGWKRGHLSRDGGSPRVSSYDALDALLRVVTNSTRFPNVQAVVVAGHSAGGQVVHRYAAGSALSGVPDEVAVRFVVANPSTYLYTTPERWIAGQLGLPDRDACPDYDEWHYGFEDLNTYMRRTPVVTAVSRLTARDVRILVGTADTLTHLLDQSCGAMLEGRNRLERGRLLMQYMDAVEPGHHHRGLEIEGVGHSSRSMFTIPSGREALFGG